MGEVQATAPSAPTAAPAPADLAEVFTRSPHPMLVLAADPPRFTMVAVNEAHLRAFGAQAQDLLGIGVFEVFPEPHNEQVAGFVKGIRESFERVLASGGADDMAIQPYTVPGPDGVPVERFFGATHTPLKDASGAITHIVSSVRDLTTEVNEQRAAQARDLLMREVDHRARNALTVVLSLLRLTGGDDIDAYRDAVIGRIEALARAQSALTRGKWEGARLRDVLEAELDGVAAEQFQLNGPSQPIRLPSDDVQAMSMIVHELVTNAAKYGALSRAGGRVAVDWGREPDGRVHMTWRETGGPPVRQPAREGFGTRLIAALVRQVDGEAACRWEPEGLVFEFSAPLTERANDARRAAEDQALESLDKT